MWSGACGIFSGGIWQKDDRNGGKISVAGFGAIA